MNQITPEIIIDGLLILVVFVSAIKAYRNGFFASIIELIGNIGSLIISWYVSSTYAQNIFNAFFRDSLITKSHNYLIQATENIDVDTAISSIIGKWPQEFVNAILSKTEENISIILTPTQEAAVKLVDIFIGPIVIACISVVVFIICFIMLRVICNILSKLLKIINNVPLLGLANKMAGFAVGVAIGSVNIILLSFLLSIIIIITGDNLSWLNSAIIAQSKILAITGMINPFLP